MTADADPPIGAAGRVTVSRTGVETKPAWRTLPSEVRRAAEVALGSPVARAMRVWGGYGPTPTFRLRLRDGRRAFLKAVGPDGNEFMHRAIAREMRVYRELGALIGAWAPGYLGVLTLPDWQAILLEDLGPKSAPPWTPGLARRVMRAYADFHNATRGVPLPGWAVWPPLPGWPPAIAGGGREAQRWLAAAAPVLRKAGAHVPAGPTCLLHNDTRSDNLRWHAGRLYLLDWPFAGAGHPERDLVPFAQSITVDGGPEPERLVAWYAERAPVDPAALTAAVVGTAAFFAGQAFLPAIPGLPRLRPFQRAQLDVTLAWAARRLDLPPPPPPALNP